MYLFSYLFIYYGNPLTVLLQSQLEKLQIYILMKYTPRLSVCLSVDAKGCVK